MAKTGFGSTLANVTVSMDKEWALPANPEQTFAVEDKEFRFCVHCHTPKPVAQIVPQGPNQGICVNCVNGRNNYVRLAARNLIPWPAAVPQPTAPEPKPAPAKPAPTPPKRVKRGAAGAAAGEGTGTPDAADQAAQILDLNAKRAAKRRG